MKAGTAKFLLRFFLIFAVMEAWLFIADTGALESAIARFEAGLLGLETGGNAVIVNSQPFAITGSCTGLVSGIILASVVFSLRKPEIGKKIAVFALGFAVLFILNLARLYIVLLGALEYGAFAGEVLHAVSWFAVAGLVLVVWYFLTMAVAGKAALREML